MRIKAAGTALTVGELRELLNEAEAHYSTNLYMAGFGSIVTAECYSNGLEFEVVNDGDYEELNSEMWDLLHSIAEGKAGTLKAIREAAGKLIGS